MLQILKRRQLPIHDTMSQSVKLQSIEFLTWTKGTGSYIRPITSFVVLKKNGRTLSTDDTVA